ncbi:MAG: glycoside hydrolase family 31 protein, partial [Oscillospiraceae bacterium]
MKIQNYDYLNQNIDVSEQFHTLGNVTFLAQKLNHFDGKRGALQYSRFERKGRVAFNMYSTPFEASQSWAFPPVYSDSPEYPFQVEFINESTVRIRTTGVSTDHDLANRDAESLMLDGIPHSLKVTPYISDETHAVYRTEKLELELIYEPFHVILRDRKGKELTKTLHQSDSRCLQNYNPMPFSYVRSSTDMHKYPAVSFSIKPDEHFFGCGESFTKLDKLGQKVVLWTKDANGVETEDLYKPVPFYVSSRGYGVFYHTSCPITLDFGREYAEAQTAYLGDENIDFFLFVGTPKEVLGAYTDLTGKSPAPPLWSYGLWMSRISYRSETETREVAKALQEHRIPCDVIHLDTNWFEEDWLCNYKFAPSRFENPEKMIRDLREMGYKICLWQIPYFTPKNELYDEVMEQGLAIYGEEGKLPTDDAILDFSNPAAVAWYQKQLKSLFDMGVCA